MIKTIVSRCFGLGKRSTPMIGGWRSRQRAEIIFSDKSAWSGMAMAGSRIIVG